MAKRKRKQTRRSISVKGITFQRLKNYAESVGKTPTTILEELVAEKLDAAGEPVPEKLEIPEKPEKPEKPVPDEIISQHFTF